MLGQAGKSCKLANQNTQGNEQTLIILFSSFLSTQVFAQVGQSSTSANPEMTAAFVDSLQKEIIKIMPNDYSIRLIYVSPVSDQGKLLDPKILRETANGTAEE